MEKRSKAKETAEKLGNWTDFVGFTGAERDFVYILMEIG
jgi:hypothetical protein